MSAMARQTAGDEFRISYERQGDDLVLQMGPQHPSTHGVLRLEIVTDGELVKHITPHLGYLHRCFEKHAEAMTYPQVIPYADRMDYLSAMNQELAYVLAVEKLMGLKGFPDRLEYIRVLMAELQRIASHLLAIGTYGLDLGAMTPFFWCLRDREKILDLFEWASGARLLYNYLWIGGVAHDLPAGYTDKVMEFVTYFEPRVQELNDLLSSNKIFIERAASIGILTVEDAISYGVGGPNLRGSGVKWDLRKEEPYGIYERFDFDVPVGTGEFGVLGSAWDRYIVRVREMLESLKIIRQGRRPNAGRRSQRGHAAAHSPGEGRGVSAHRIAARRVGLLPGQRRHRETVPLQGALTVFHCHQRPERHEPRRHADCRRRRGGRQSGHRAGRDRSVEQ